MNENALRIVTLAVELLARWDWSKGEPLAALTMASLRLFGSELHAEISSIRTAEKEFLPGSQSNNADARLAALRAVIKFRAKTIGVAMG